MHLFNKLCRIFGVKIIAVAAMIGLSACSFDFSLKDKTPDFVAKFWNLPKPLGFFPEMADYDLMHNRASFGVAFHGGGNRAAPTALGQLRALHDLGWIDDVRYISAISGGSWTAIPYTFLNTCTESGALDRFLGKYYAPRDLVSELVTLQAVPKGETHLAFGKGTMLAAINDSLITSRYLRAVANGHFDESYARALEKIYFERFGLGRVKPGTDSPERLFTWREADMLELVARNPALISREDVDYVHCPRPYLIVGGTLLTKRLSPGPKDKIRLEMTPLYTGAAHHFRSEFGNGEKARGGGYVESAGYDRVTNKVIVAGGQKLLQLRLPVFGARSNPTRLRFSLQNMAAVSGAAPQETILKPALINILTSNLGFPEHFVPVDQPTPKVPTLFATGQRPYEKEWAHGDGGHEDNLGLAPHLSRGVQNILAFVNTSAPLDRAALATCRATLKTARADIVKGAGGIPTDYKGVVACQKMIGDDLASFFFATKGHIHNVSLARVGQNRGAGSDWKPYYDVLSIVDDFLTSRHNSKAHPDKGDGLSCGRYNAFGSKEMGYSPTICFLWLMQDQNWFDQLGTAARQQDLSVEQKQKLQNHLDLGQNWRPNGRPKRRLLAKHGFPYIGTFFDADGRVIKVVKPRALALANYTSWMLKTRSRDIAAAFAKTGLILD